MLSLDKIKQLKELLLTKSQKEQLEIVKYLATKDLYFLSEGILRNPDSEPVELSKTFHKQMCDWLEGSKPRRLLMASRGHLKSTVANRNYIIWRIINNPNITILIVSATLDNAKKKLRAIQEIFERNKDFQIMFPEIIPKSFGEKWTQTQMTVPRNSAAAEATVECQGYESELTSRHYDLIIFDDVVGKENSATKEQIEKVINFYTQSLQLLKKPYGEMLVIGTIWNYADLHNHILENLSDQYEFFVRSIWANDYMQKDARGKWEWATSGERTPLYPELFNLDSIEKLKKEIVSDSMQGISTWMAQYEMKVVDDATSVFPRDRKSADDFWFKEEDLYDKKIAFSLTCDPAVSEKKQADETAFCLRAVDESGVWYVVDMFAKRGMRENEIVNKYVWYLINYPIDLATIETISFQRNLKYAIDEKCREEKIYFPYYKLPSYFNQASKLDSDMKIRGLAPLYITGKLRFKAGCLETIELLDQMWRFPKAKHDDRVDVLAQNLHLPIYPTKIWKTTYDVVKSKQSGSDRYGYKIEQTLNNQLYI